MNKKIETDVKTDEIILAPSSEETTSSVEESVPICAKKDMVKKERRRVSEIRELRAPNKKVFEMNDGTKEAVIYPHPVHILDEETGTYADVDATLEMKDGEKRIRNRKGRFKAEFNCEADNDELFVVEKGIHRITVLSKKNKKNRKTPMSAKLHRKDSADSVLFENLEEATDVEYFVNACGVKEDIIVKEKKERYSYSFSLKCENVKAEYDEFAKKISFKDSVSDEEVFFIPAPVMYDALGVDSNLVDYDLNYVSEDTIQVSVVADDEWINAEEREFPVIIDPQIMVSGTSSINTYSWVNGTMSTDYKHQIHSRCSDFSTPVVKRMYVKLDLPVIAGNPRIKKVELKLKQVDWYNTKNAFHMIGLYPVIGDITTGTCTPETSDELVDYVRAKLNNGNPIVDYVFDITSYVESQLKGETNYTGLVVKMINEDSDCCNVVTLGGATHSWAPVTMNVTYESSYGVNSSYATDTHDLGFFGQGSVDLACGNLMFDAVDFAWNGTRMPVTLRHMYNSALSSVQYTRNDSILLKTADFSAMKIGNGFKLNLMQSIVSTVFQHEGVESSGYVYIGENGEEVYLKQSKTVQRENETTSESYYLFEDVSGSGILYDEQLNTLENGSETYHFENGRLVMISDEYNRILIEYDEDNRIGIITDGANRKSVFKYDSNGYLESVRVPKWYNSIDEIHMAESDNADIVKVTYTYDSNGNLASVTYPENKKVEFAYSAFKPTSVVLKDGDDLLHKVEYEYSGELVHKVKEYGAENGIFVLGTIKEYSYSASANRTIVSTVMPEENTIKHVYAFDDEGNVVSEYMYSESTGNVGTSGIEPMSDGGGVVSNINNLLKGHSFEDITAWTSVTDNDVEFETVELDSSKETKYGRYLLRMHSNNPQAVANGVYQETINLPADNYTFSAYVKVTYALSGCETAGAYLRILNASGEVLAESEHLSAESKEYEKLVVPFELTTAQQIKAELLVDGAGTVNFDAPQLENNDYANDYNLLENGNFEHGSDCWTPSNGVVVTSEERFNMSNSLSISGNVYVNYYASQAVKVKSTRSTRETFVLSGWAKANAVPTKYRDNHEGSQFRLRAVLHYEDVENNVTKTETYTADFAASTKEWQFASVEFAKSEMYSLDHVEVFCDYFFNGGVAYFDDIQLVRKSIETNLSESDFAKESDIVDNEEPESEMEDTAPAFEEVKDPYGNVITETTFTDGEFGTIYRGFRYIDTIDDEVLCNNLVYEFDSRGEQTKYIADKDTSRNDAIVDRCYNKTAYEYDDAGRTTKVTSHKAIPDANGEFPKDEEGNVIYDDIQYTELANVSYSYDAFDNMTEIHRGDGMKYALAYNAFHNLSTIGIEGKSEPLVSYDYKNGSGRLKSVTYANSDKMTATYNSIGQMIAETWTDISGKTTAQYKYAYDGNGNIVRSLDILAKIEYNYVYESGVIVKATESSVSINGNGFAVSKTVLNTIFYTYNNEGQLVKKTIAFADGTQRVVRYEHSEETTVSKLEINGETITSHSKSDSFGRKVFDELQLGYGFVSRQFSYHAGKATDTHIGDGLLKSTPTTQLVSRILFTDGRTLDYEYDAEERITKVIDSFDGTTEYTYDALGQLLTEKVNGEVVNTMTYDNYGNILTKNGVSYTYGDGVWKDLLTKVVDGDNIKEISYDLQGNPTEYFGHNLTWEKGRQLKSFDNISYTYNANGIRTSKTIITQIDDKIETKIHTYVLDGTKILRETWGENTLVPLYDNEDSVCGIIYNNTPFYFHKNLQGDIIAIADSNANIVARYTYDAWGVPAIVFDTSYTIYDDYDNATTFSIGAINPFRYRSYYYDTEIGMYYLQSRYYNPIIGRFVNADNVVIIMSNDSRFITSLFTYCSNTPTNMCDENGAAPNYINNQNDKSVKDIGWGKFGNTGNNGCGWIAVYNVMITFYKWITYKSVITALTNMGGPLLYGLFGTDPSVITSYLWKHFFVRLRLYTYTSQSGMSLREYVKAVIVLYSNGSDLFSSWHYVAGIRKECKNGKGYFRFYNDSNYRSQFGSQYITFLEYTKFLISKGRKFIYLWTIF